jgi:hypothetical protein
MNETIFVDADGHRVTEGRMEFWLSLDRPPIIDYLALGIRRRMCSATKSFLNQYLLETLLFLGWFGAPVEIAFEADA